MNKQKQKEPCQKIKAAIIKCKKNKRNKCILTITALKECKRRLKYGTF